MGLSNELSCEAGSFSHHHNPHRFLQSEVLSLYFTIQEPWVAWSVLLLSCSSWFICMQMWDRPPPAEALLRALSTQLPVSAPPTGLYECFFFNSWLSDFHTVPFSGSSCCFLFLNLLLSFFWLCEEAQCVHLDRNPNLSWFLY